MGLKEVTIMELDTVLDTRLGIYKLLGKDLNELFHEGYRNRVYDRFNGVDYDEYMKLYKGRSKRMLLCATVTELPYVFAKEAIESAEDKVGLGIDSVELWINVYPYKLSMVEKANIGESITTIMQGSSLVIKVIDVPYKDMTPEYITNNHVRTLYLYQYELWLEAQMSALIKYDNCPLKLVVKAPWLISQELDEETSRNLDTWISNGTHPCDVMRLTFINYFTLTLEKSRKYTTILADDIYPDYISPDGSAPNISS